ncbi:hypothetical protein A0H81_11991 [Grifola frondosa]|uniref:Uncharacterized protein n=1 Tax=Grifola frondosa TaxID=5627 RepID=A0A1C7LVD1_GRIFR|nr:hypothetical protein A0H81_11991 [Grifola frondosa]
MLAFWSSSPGKTKDLVAELPKEKDIAASVGPSVEVNDPEPQTGDARDQDGVKGPTERGQMRFSWRVLVSAKGPQRPSPAVRSQRKQNDTPIDRKLTRTRSEQRARESALLKVVSPRNLQNVKSQLLQPRTANKVIAQLRTLPCSDTPVPASTSPDGAPLASLPKGPIHAVCLPYTDAEAHDQHFSLLATLIDEGPEHPATTRRNVAVQSKTASGVFSVTATSVEQIGAVLSKMHIVSLITAPDLGIGQPGSGPGLLSGAVPTAKTVINGIEQITPQLMALGYATGKAVLPDHAGIYPPTDRMSVITYWWGLEVVMPEPSIEYLSNVPSVTHAVINFLTAVSMVNYGVREILPFVRYISQFIDMEFNSIKAQDEGKGVVCAATWIMPAALVPRPWDFPEPPTTPSSDTTQSDSNDAIPTTSPTTDPASSRSPRPHSLTLLPPTFPEHNRSPKFVIPNAAPPEDKTETPAGSPSDDVPMVKVIPPTPRSRGAR